MSWQALCRTCRYWRVVRGLSVCESCRQMHNARHRIDRRRDPRRVIARLRQEGKVTHD